MSVGTEPEHTETQHPQAEHPPEHEPGGHEHPSDGKYVIVAVILAIITALEVLTYFWEEASTTLLVITLIPMMIAKFAIVCGWFMHLRYDNPLFRRVFVVGLVLAVAVYLIAMSTLHWFQPAWTQA
jgi:cytochrome c oxidase subunit 4